MSIDASNSRDDVCTLVDHLLAEQGRLSAVDVFSRAHEGGGVPALEPHYRRLIPLTAPRPGEQYAFEVDLDRCSGCKACVTACHSLNGLDEGEAWREVGQLTGERIDRSRPESGSRVISLTQVVTTACHHCVEPACLLGCPVLAYEKNPVTGIVRHLDDQCIGCSYCILMCPYEVPKYSATRGIVRKCDMCHGRLAEGEAPACVQACPNEAIRIGLVETEWVTLKFRPPGSQPRAMTKSLSAASLSASWLPDAPDPSLTLPTTRYITRQYEAELRSADHALPRSQPFHWPLVWMLVCTQGGVGGLALGAIAGFDSGAAGTLGTASIVSLLLMFIGLAASVFHLGQPFKAWRVWLGWRNSWLSREAIALNMFTGLGVAWIGYGLLCGRMDPGSVAHLVSSALLVIIGGFVLYAQAMVYAATRREFWKAKTTVPRFCGTAVVLGCSVGLAVAGSPRMTHTAVITVGLISVTLLKLALEISVLKEGDTDEDRWTALRRTAVLQRGVLRPILCLRIVAGLLGGVLLPFAGLVFPELSALDWKAVGFCFVGEMAERCLFFRSVVPDKMPGAPGEFGNGSGVSS